MSVEFIAVEWIGFNGKGYGHSTYSYWTQSSDMEGTPYYNEYPNTQQFNAQFSFPGTTGQGWQALQSWQWTPSETDPADTYNSHTQVMPSGNMFHYSGSSDWEGTAKPKSTKVISYSATDTDGATAEAQYELTLHDPYERKTHDISLNQKSNVRPHPYGGLATSTTPNESVTVSCTETFGWSVTGSVTGSLSDWIAKGLGLSANISGSVSASSGASSGHTVTNLGLNKATYLEIFDLHDVHSGLADKWKESGYDGEATYEFKVPSSIPWGTQVHTPYIDVNPAPGGGGN